MWDGSNKRTDEYGGSIENRSKFCLEIIDAIKQVYSSDRIGIKLSPVGRFNDMYDSNPKQLYWYLLEQLSKKEIGFVEMMRTGEFLTKPSRWGKGED